MRDALTSLSAGKENLGFYKKKYYHGFCFTHLPVRLCSINTGPSGLLAYANKPVRKAVVSRAKINY